MAITSVSSSAQVTHQGPSGNYGSAMAMVTALFFVWGFLTSLNDILVPHLKSIFELNFTQVMLVQFAFFSSYFIFAVPAGRVVERIGYKRTMVVGLLTMALGAILFVPAAMVPSFSLFLGALIVLAAGITALQVAANPYVSVLGPADTASSRLNLTQAFNSLGTTVGPPLGGWLILGGAATMTQEQLRKLSPSALALHKIEEASTVKGPYILIALALVLLALAIGLSKLPQITQTQEFRPAKGRNGLADVSMRALLSQRHLILGVIAIFVYVGAEVSVGSFLVNYFGMPEIGGISAQKASLVVSIYWGGAMLGRFIGSAILQKVKPGLLLGFNAIVAAILVSISILTTGHVAMWSILLVGLFNSIMFPTIFTLGIAELGPLTGKGSGLMVSAIVGGAVFPLIEGALADKIGLQHSFVLPVLCYIYVAYYGLRGSRIRQEA